MFKIQRAFNETISILARKWCICYMICCIFGLCLYMIILTSSLNFLSMKRFREYSKINISELANTDKIYNKEIDAADEDSVFHPSDEELAFFRATCIEARLTFITRNVNNLYDLKSPQGKAFHWILNEDLRALHSDAENLTQRYILAVLYYALSGDNWHYTSQTWLMRVHECHWKRYVKGKAIGVTQCNSNMHVTKIDFTDNNLQGSMPNEIGYLTNLISLDLKRNLLTGTIPESFMYLESITSIRLDENLLTGEIPTQLAKLNNLEKFRLEMNSLSGTVSSDFCSTSSLTSFKVDCLGTQGIRCSCCSMCCDHTSGFCGEVDQYGFITDDSYLHEQMMYYID